MKRKEKWHHFGGGSWWKATPSGIVISHRDGDFLDGMPATDLGTIPWASIRKAIDRMTPSVVKRISGLKGLNPSQRRAVSLGFRVWSKGEYHLDHNRNGGKRVRHYTILFWRDYRKWGLYDGWRTQFNTFIGYSRRVKPLAEEKDLWRLLDRLVRDEHGRLKVLR
jgi:hypothetical protein